MNDRPLSEEKIGVDQKEYNKEDEETYKESDSGVGSESPNLISTISFDDDDVQIDDLFLCRTKSAFSRISLSSSLDSANNKMMLERRRVMVTQWMREVKEKNWDVDEWWKETGLKVLQEEGMDEESIIDFWESKMWFWGECQIIMELLAGKVLELRREQEQRRKMNQMKILDVKEFKQ